jgi:hypothetical protein
MPQMSRAIVAVLDGGAIRSVALVERYAQLAPDYLAKAAGRLDSLLGGYDLATLEKDKGSVLGSTP